MKTTGIIMILLVATLTAPLGQIFAQTAPVSPTNLTAQAASGSQIELSWVAPINSTQGGVNGYRIERDVGCVGVFSVLVANTTTTSTTYSDTGLLSDFCYSYRVSALNSAGASIPSNTASATTHGTPSAPTGLTVTKVSSSSLKLAWNAPADNGGSQVIGYQIQRNGTTIIANTANNQTTYLDTGLLPAHQQTYRVAAWNSVGLGAFSANVTQTTNQTSTPTNKENLGQAISDFVHKRNEIFKKQRDETLKVIRECNDKVRSANATERKQIRDDCREMLQSIKERYKETRKQLQEEFKVFRDVTKLQLKEEKKADLITKQDVKEIKREFKSFKNDTKREEKELKHDIKEMKKEFKKQQKELKKEQKKKDREHDDEDDD
ncbi:MAG TPA: fibronectin type III domain-containing protein [Candidatus Nitrosotenuis sp.]|nr:fibronectin type III domain-containing protein [Candidatus Nitrosotenuis sp.]